MARRRRHVARWMILENSWLVARFSLLAVTGPGCFLIRQPMREVMGYRGMPAAPLDSSRRGR